jgi:hypothetical protein
MCVEFVQRIGTLANMATPPCDPLESASLDGDDRPLPKQHPRSTIKRKPDRTNIFVLFILLCLGGGWRLLQNKKQENIRLEQKSIEQGFPPPWSDTWKLKWPGLEVEATGQFQGAVLLLYRPLSRGSPSHEKPA